MNFVEQPFPGNLIAHCQDQHAHVTQFANELLSATEAEITAILEQLTVAVRNGEVSAAATFWEELFGVLQVWQLRGTQAHRPALGGELREKIILLYSELAEACAVRFRLLQWLTLSGQPNDLSAFVTALCDDPPTTPDAAALPFVPLLAPATNAAFLFPQIKPCLSNPLLAAPVIDVANYLKRQQMVDIHPLTDDHAQLIRTLSGITRELEALQEDPSSAEDAARDRALTGVTLAVSLCDALALIGNDAALASLSHALSLKHRRLRIEAAAALARFDDAAGKEALIACAADPVTRLRALHYAEELEIENEIDESHRAPAAIAEAELVSYLMQPSAMGVPPSSCELIDERSMYWPGFEEPRQCFLFRFSYGAMVDSEYLTFSNIAIAGPVVHTFKADLGNLPADDIYAAYAGWQAEHPEIVQSAVGAATGFGGAVEELVEHLQRDDFQRVQPVIAGRFFGDDVIAAAAERNGVAGAVITDGETTLWYPAEGTPRPITPAEAYCIYKGRRLLRQFN